MNFFSPGLLAEHLRFVSIIIICKGVKVNTKILANRFFYQDL